MISTVIWRAWRNWSRMASWGRRSGWATHASTRPGCAPRGPPCIAPATRAQPPREPARLVVSRRARLEEALASAQAASARVAAARRPLAGPWALLGSGLDRFCRPGRSPAVASRREPDAPVPSRPAARASRVLRALAPRARRDLVLGGNLGAAEEAAGFVELDGRVARAAAVQEALRVAFGSQGCAVRRCARADGRLPIAPTPSRAPPGCGPPLRLGPSSARRHPP